MALARLCLAPFLFLLCFFFVVFCSNSIGGVASGSSFGGFCYCRSCVVVAAGSAAAAAAAAAPLFGLFALVLFLARCHQRYTVMMARRKEGTVQKGLKLDLFLFFFVLFLVCCFSPFSPSARNVASLIPGLSMVSACSAWWVSARLPSCLCFCCSFCFLLPLP